MVKALAVQATLVRSAAVMSVQAAGQPDSHTGRISEMWPATIETSQ
jgi:hypothetical protein